MNRNIGYLMAINIMAYSFSYSQQSPSSPNSVSVRYDFENGISGWTFLNQADSKACINVSRSNTYAKEGTYSLKCDMDLDGESQNNTKGEAYVDFGKSAPAGLKSPANLNGRTITVSVFAPVGSKGDLNNPNGLQVFVKDANGKCLYGRRMNINEGQWNDISLPVSSSGTQDGFLQDGFDPTHIVVLGVKMSIGNGSNAKFSGSIYVDKVFW